MFRWLKNYTRGKTLFMDPIYAAQTKNKLALAYTLLSWNLFGFVVYYLFMEKVPKTQDSIDYAKVYGIKEAKVLKFSGFKKVDEYDIRISDEELDEFKQVIGKPEEKKIYDEKNEQRRKEAEKARQELTNTEFI